ncbi:PepSY-associated TM helix domain-containing protein, partial [Paraprevotella clara]
QTLKGWFYAFHTGSWGGVWTKVLYFLAAFIGGILPLSGYYLWYKRKFSSRRKR